VALAKVFDNREMLSVSLEHAGRFAWTESVHSLEEVYRLASTLTGGRI